MRVKFYQKQDLVGESSLYPEPTSILLSLKTILLL